MTMKREVQIGGVRLINFCLKVKSENLNKFKD